MSFLNILDSQITITIYNLLPHTKNITTFFSFFSLYGNSFFIWIIAALIAILLEKKKYPGIQKKDVKFLVTFFLSFITTSTTILVLKQVFQRPRPFVPELVKAISCNMDYAMPSGHAGAAFAAATVLASFDKKRALIYYLIAVLVSVSRIYLGCHYFFDVIVGAALGYLFSTLLLKLKY